MLSTMTRHRKKYHYAFDPDDWVIAFFLLNQPVLSQSLVTRQGLILLKGRKGQRDPFIVTIILRL